MVKLSNSDFEKYLHNIPDESVDAIITDIPYNVSRESGFESIGRTIDFGEWDKGFNESSLSLLVPKVKKGGSIFVFHAFEQFHSVSENFLPMECKDKLIWRKPNAFPRNRDRRYIGNIEMASWYVKEGKPWTFNRQNESYDESVLTYPVEKSAGRFHPTQKNLDLMIEIIKRHTNEGDTVLDPFMGSGTTGVACILNKRNFIGIELNKEYFDKTVKRIKDTLPLFEVNNLIIDNE